MKNLKSLKSDVDVYSKINLVNGTHDWQQAVPESCVMYPVKKLNKGRKQIAISRYEDQVTVIINELDILF